MLSTLKIIGGMFLLLYVPKKFKPLALTFFIIPTKPVAEINARIAMLYFSFSLPYTSLQKITLLRTLIGTYHLFLRL